MIHPNSSAMGLVDVAIIEAVWAHRGQRCKVGRPAILHPLRVMEAVKNLGEEAMAAAVLHDVVEDTDVTLADLRATGFSPQVVEVVDLCSRPPDGSPDRPTYRAFIERIRASGNPIAIAVKIADVRDNMERLGEQPEDQRGIITRYRVALIALEGGL